MECGLDKKCHNIDRVEGEACGPGAKCANGLSCLALVQRCIRSGSVEALDDTLEAYKDDPVVKDTMGGKSGGEVETMSDSVESSENCSSDTEEEMETCLDGPSTAATKGLASSTSSEEKDTIDNKMGKISHHFQQRLRYYQLKEYERLGIEPPAVLLDETNIVSLVSFFES